MAAIMKKQWVPKKKLDVGPKDGRFEITFGTLPPVSITNNEVLVAGGWNKSNARKDEVVQAERHAWSSKFTGHHRKYHHIGDETNNTLMYMNGEELQDFSARAAFGSLFKTLGGKDTTTMTALRAAARLNLAYDVAANVFVCPHCLSAATSSLYFRCHHSDHCSEYQRSGTAVVQTRDNLKVVNLHGGVSIGTISIPAVFDVFPQYTTDEHEAQVANLIRDAFASYDDHRVDAMVQVFNYKTGDHDVVRREVNVDIGTYEQEITVNHCVRPTIRHPRLIKNTQRAQRLVSSTHEIHELILQVAEICHQDKKPLVFVDEVSKKRKFPRIPLRHMRHKGITASDDMYEETFAFLEHYADCVEPVEMIQDYQITNGWSGVVLSEADLPDHLKAKCVKGLFVVQGRDANGQLQNALAPKEEEITYYSDLIETIGKEKADAFSKILVKTRYHIGHSIVPSNRSVEEWQSLGVFFNAIVPDETMWCASCPERTLDLEMYVRTVQSRSAFVSLSQRRDPLGLFLRQFLGHLINRIQPPAVRMEIDDLTVQVDNSVVSTIGPLFEVTNSVLRSIQQLHRSLDSLDRVIDRKVFDDANIRIMRDEIARLRGDESLKPEMFKYRMDIAAVTFITVLNATALPLRPETMRQLFSDLQTTDRNEFDFTRSKASLDEICPEAYREYKDVIRDGKTNPEWEFLLQEDVGYKTDIDYLRVDLTCEDLKNKAHPTYSTSIGAQCSTMINGKRFLLCLANDNCFIPYPHTVRVGSPSCTTLLRLPDVRGSKTYLPKRGYCYVTQLVIMLGFVESTLVQNFIDLIRIAVHKLGPWPTYRAYLDEIRILTLLYPSTLRAPTAVHLIHHETQTMHVMSTLGCVTKGMHTLNVNSVGFMINVAITANLSGLLDYRIGGTIDDFKLMLSSADSLRKVLESRPEWLVQIFLSPSWLWALGVSVDRYRVVDYYASTNIELAAALAGLVEVSKNYHLLRDADRVIDDYFKEMPARLQDMQPIVGDQMSQIEHALGYFLSIRKPSNVLRMFDIWHLKKPLTIEASEGLYRPIVQRFMEDYELYGAWYAETFRYHSRLYAQGLRDVTQISLRQLGKSCWNQVLRLGGATWWTITTVKSGVVQAPAGIWGCIVRVCDNWTTRGTLRLAQNFCWAAYRKTIDQAAMVAFILLTACAILHVFSKCMTFMRRLIAQQRSMIGCEEIVAHGRKVNDQLLIKILAWASFITALFNNGLSQDLYMNLTKYRTLFDIVTSSSGENITFHGDNSDSAFDDFIQKDSFMDFNFATLESKIDEDRETVEMWIKRREVMDTMGQHPLGVIEGEATMVFTREDGADIARAITTSRNTEFRVIGAVGSGKSTALPGWLSTHGTVLILVPSRELAFNLYDSILFCEKKEPSVYVYKQHVHGSSNITIMTYGYALIFLNANKHKIGDYRYIQMDECHEFSAHMQTFYSFIKENRNHNKLIKTTATPPGTTINSVTRTVSTNHRVTVQQIRGCSVEEYARMCISAHADSFRASHPDKARVVIFVPSKADCEKLRATIIPMGNVRVWVVTSDTKFAPGELVKQLQEDNTKYQVLVTTTVLQNGVNLDADVVVDFGTTYEAVYDVEQRAISTRRRSINPGEVIQRLGRVGRNKPGTYVQVGVRPENESEPNAVDMTDAILMCFAMDLPPYVRGNYLDDIPNVTREQVKTAMHFSLPLLFVIHYVQPNGKMLREYYHELKGALLHTAEIEFMDNLLGDSRPNSFRTLQQYKQCGLIKTEIDMPAHRVPWFYHPLSASFYLSVGQATEKAFVHLSFTIRVPTYNMKDAVVRLSTNRDGLNKSIMILGHKLQLAQRQLDDIAQLNATTQSFPTFGLLNSIGARHTESARRRLNSVIHAGNILRTALMDAQTTVDDGALEKLLRDNPLLADHITYHGTAEEYFDERIFMRSNSRTIKIVASVIGVACVVGLCVWFYLRQAYDLCAHGNGELGAHLRDSEVKRESAFFEGDEHVYQAPQWDGTDRAITQRLGAAYSKKYRGKEKPDDYDESRGTWDKRAHEQHTREYNTFYKADPRDYKYTVVELDSFGIKKRLDGLEKLDLDSAIKQAVRDKCVSDGIAEIPDIDEAIVYLFNHVNDPAGQKIRLTPHNPLVASRTTTKPVGYPERAGALRQTRSKMEVTAEDYARVADTITAHAGESAIHVSQFHKQMGVISSGIGRMNCIISGGRVIVPYHFGSYISDERAITIQTLQGLFSIAKKPTICKVGDQDLVYFDLPQDLPRFKSIRGWRPPRTGERVLLLSVERSARGLDGSVSTTVVVTPHDNGLWKYNLRSFPGLCGSMVLSVSDWHIVGVHSGGGRIGKPDEYAVFTPMTVEGCELLVKPDSPQVEWIFNDALISWKGSFGSAKKGVFPFNLAWDLITAHGLPSCKGDHQFGANLTLQGVFRDTFNNRHVIKGRDADFQEFVLHHPAPGNLDAYAPSELSIDAFYLDLLKYGQPVIGGNLHIDALKQATRAVIAHLEEQGFKRNECRVIRNPYDVYNDLNLNAAMGAMYGCKKKQVLPTATHDELETWFWNALDHLHQGGSGLWKASLKAELRPAEKVRLHKTRVFTAAPFESLIAAKCFVDDFNRKFYARHRGSRWTVGINKFNLGWHNLSRQFNHEWRFLDADGSQYDSSLTPILFNEVCKIREYFLDANDDDVQCLRNFYTQLVWTPIVAITGQVFKKHKGGPSGQPSTVVDNTLMLMLAIEYARARCALEGKPCTDMRYICNGDDLLINAPDVECDIIRSHFTQYLFELGLKYTFDQQVDSILDVEYMSLTWQKVGNLFIPKLKEDRILAILAWKRSDDLEATAHALNAAWIESFGYPDLMNYVRDFADVWGDKHNVTDFLMSYSDVILLYLSDEVQITPFIDVAYDIIEAHAATTKDGDTTEATTSGTKSDDKDADKKKDSTVVITPPKEATNVIANPQVKRRGLYIPGKMKAALTEDTLKKVASYAPSDALISIQAASVVQLNRWFGALADGYGKDDTTVMTDVVPYFVYWCIVNGASERHRMRDSWVKVNYTADSDGNFTNLDENAPQTEMKMSVIFEEAKPTLRAIMRHFGNLAREWVRASVRNGTPIIPHNAASAGVTDPQYYAACIDFITEEGLSPVELNVRNQVLNARTQGAKSEVFQHAKAPGADSEDTELKLPGAANYGRSSLKGAVFPN